LGSSFSEGCMIPKSGHHFSEKDLAQRQPGRAVTFSS
jgi:hypothetical protein